MMCMAANIKKGNATFSQNLDQHRLPSVNSIDYGSIFSNYYFSFEKNDTNKLVDIQSCASRVFNSLSKQDEDYLGVGLLSSLDGKNQREDQNLIILLDISGSMSSTLNYGSSDKRSKMDLAKFVCSEIFKKLRPQERFGLLTFNTETQVIQNLEAVSEINSKTLLDKIDSIHSTGGTVMDSTYETAIQIMKSGLESAKSKTQIPQNNRIIIITDACINNPQEKDGLIKLNETASAYPTNIFTTFIGVGVDFDIDLVNSLTKVRGANYLSTKSNEDFIKILNEDFNYLVSVAALNAYVQLISDEIEIIRTCGSNYDILEDPSKQQDDILAMKAGNVLKVETLTPYGKDERGVKGGIVLVQIKRKDNIAKDQPINIKVKITYEDINQKVSEEISEIILDFKNSQVNETIKKAFALSQFVDQMKNFIKQFETAKVDTNRKEEIKKNIHQYKSEFMELISQYPNEDFKDDLNNLQMLLEY